VSVLLHMWDQSFEQKYIKIPHMAKDDIHGAQIFQLKQCESHMHPPFFPHCPSYDPGPCT